MLRGIYNREDVKPFVSEAERMIADYGWEDRTVMPYSRPEKISRLLRRISQYDRCTEDSRWLLEAEANGLAEIMNHWEVTELTGVGIIIIETGKYRKIERDFADELVGRGYATYA